MKTELIRTIQADTRLTLDGRDIMDALIACGRLTENDLKNWSVTFQVPRGGDYSGCVLDVDADSPVIVVIRHETKEVL